MLLDLIDDLPFADAADDLENILHVLSELLVSQPFERFRHRFELSEIQTSQKYTRCLVAASHTFLTKPPALFLKSR